MKSITKGLCGLALLAASSVSYAGAINNLSDLTGVPGFEAYTNQAGWYGAGLDDTDHKTDDITFFYMFTEETSNADNNSFGLYNFVINPDETVTVGDTLEIFDGSVNAMSTSIFGQLTPTNTTVTFDWDLGLATNNATGDAVALNEVFGFYLDTGNGVLYSHNSLNPNEVDSLLMFDVSDNGVPGLQGSNLLLAWEDGVDRDMDYNDMIIGISDVHGVPTPATFALMGLGLLAMRVKSNRKIA